MVAILDTLKTIKPDVSTIAFGQSLSTATLLLVRSASTIVLGTTPITHQVSLSCCC